MSLSLVPGEQLLCPLSHRVLPNLLPHGVVARSFSLVNAESVIGLAEERLALSSRSRLNNNAQTEEHHQIPL